MTLFALQDERGGERIADRRGYKEVPRDYWGNTYQWEPKNDESEGGRCWRVFLWPGSGYRLDRFDLYSGEDYEDIIETVADYLVEHNETDYFIDWSYATKEYQIALRDGETDAEDEIEYWEHNNYFYCPDQNIFVNMENAKFKDITDELEDISDEPADSFRPRLRHSRVRDNRMRRPLRRR